MIITMSRTTLKALPLRSREIQGLYIIGSFSLGQPTGRRQMMLSSLIYAGRGDAEPQENGLGYDRATGSYPLGGPDSVKRGDLPKEGKTQVLERGVSGAPSCACGKKKPEGSMSGAA